MRTSHGFPGPANKGSSVLLCTYITGSMCSLAVSIGLRRIPFILVSLNRVSLSVCCATITLQALPYAPYPAGYPVLVPGEYRF
ncbi:hypothetical protein K449DRAFT_436747 [Hypoxylon sp. EC38]|nr:hypothetical protein K449DRAFT_436747 [Hypoxylon sp. EC38]